MQEIIKYSGCFVCGDQNPDGLRIAFHYDGLQAVAEYTADPRYQGYPGIFHGGLIATLLDEIMAKAVLARKRYCMAAEMSVRYHRAIPVDLSLRLTGQVTSDHGRMLETAGQIHGLDGNLYASAKGKYLEAASQMKDLI